MNEWIAVSCANKLEKAKEALEAANKRIKELEAANENCISLSLHESRMFGAEQREKQLQSQNATLLAQVKIYRDALEHYKMIDQHEGYFHDTAEVALDMVDALSKGK